MEALSNYKFIYAFLLLGIVSCGKEDITQNVKKSFSYGDDAVHISASISADTKTQLDDFKVIWEKDDVIEVFPAGECLPSGFALESGEGSSSAIFTGNISGAPVMAKYPFMSNDRYQNGQISTEISDQQVYVPGSFASGASPMAAVPNQDGDICFHNLCSVLRITLTGEAVVEEIIVSTEDEDCYLAGPAKIKLVGGVPVLTIEPLNTKATIHVVGDGYPSVHLNCGSTQLYPAIRSTFYIVVPSQEYASGLKIDVSTKLGMFSKHTGRLDLNSSTLYDTEPINVEINGGIEPSPFLKGAGNQSSPYLVSSVGDLLHIQQAMAAKGKITNENGKDGTAAVSSWFLLTDDIDLSVCCGPEIGSWQPLTVNRNFFKGHFDGGGHSITGLYIDNSEGYGSFFGDIYTNGYLGNLEVRGDVTAEDASIVAGSVYGILENCTSIGSVYGTLHAGGIVSTNFGTVRHCVNYAEVENTATLYCGAGGIAATSISCSFEDCTNYGTISALSGNCKAAGIVGRDQESIIVNCYNLGEITGSMHSAGICGDTFQTDILNCANYGSVHGTSKSTTLCAGILGEMSDPFSNKTGSIKNCINVGLVDNGKSNCGICAKNVLQVKYCYWLNTLTTGVSGGTQTGLVSLTASQMKGTSPSPSLYSGCTSLVDALNSFGFDNSTADLVLNGWTYDATSGWPVSTGRPALPPGQLDKFIKTNPSSYTLNTYSQSIELVVTSSASVNLSLPSWISKKSSKIDEIGSTLYTTFVLDVQQNKSGGQRSGNIIIESSDDCNASVSVTQRYTYISEDYSRDGNVVTLQKASEGAGIDIVLMGDAYTDQDIKNGKYESDIKRGVEAFFSVEPYASFRNMFNIYYVELISSSSEIGSSTALETYFGSGTLVGGNDSKVRNLCYSVTQKSNLDDVTAIVIINTARYAGTCYMYYSYSGDHGLGFSVSYFPLGTASTGQTSMEALIRHESAGHGFGKLADEYSYQSQGTIPSSEVNNYRNRQNYGWWPNVDFTSDPFSVRWSSYIQDNRYAAEEINVYEGGATYWSGVWRPTLNSIMRYNTGQFNAPSRQAIYYKIHRLAYGSSWKYDHETFVEYDAVNRSGVSVTANTPTDEEIATFRPTHPPVIISEY